MSEPRADVTPTAWIPDSRYLVELANAAYKDRLACAACRIYRSICNRDADQVNECEPQPDGVADGDAARNADAVDGEAHREAAARVAPRPSPFTPRPSRRLLDGHDPLGARDRLRQRVEQRGLARAGGPGDEQVPSRGDRPRMNCETCGADWPDAEQIARGTSFVR